MSQLGHDTHDDAVVDVVLAVGARSDRAAAPPVLAVPPLPDFNHQGDVSTADKAIVAWSAVAKLPTQFGTFDIRAFRDRQQREHVVLSLGEVAGQRLVPVRVHSECLTSEVLGSLRCDCNTQLEMALAYIAERKMGMLIYLRQEGRGTGLVSKIDAYALQDTGLDTVEASGALGVPVDARTYELAGEVIRVFNVESIALLTNNPAKIESLRSQGIDVASRVRLRGEANEFNSAYLNAKQAKLHHLT